MQDEKIVQLYWDRNEMAITETQKKYDKYLTKIAYNILSDFQDSEESVNDTYLAAWDTIPPQKPTVLSSYLSKITRRISIDIFRKKHRQKRMASEYAISLNELGDCVSGSETPEEECETKLLVESINRFIQNLDTDSRNLFIGRYYFLDPLKDVASYCGIKESKAKNLLYKTRCELKEFLKKEGFEI